MKDSATCLGEHRTLTVSVERLPHLTMKAGSAPGNEPLLDRLPIGIHASGRGVFLYLGLPTARDGFQAFLGRHAKRSDPSLGRCGWCFRVRSRTRTAGSKGVFRKEFENPLHGHIVGAEMVLGRTTDAADRTPGVVR